MNFIRGGLRRLSTSGIRMYGNELYRMKPYKDPNPQELAAAAQSIRNVAFFVCLPLIGLLSVVTFVKERKHVKHFEKPEYVPYPYLVHSVDFPWGDGKKGLLHNPRVNYPMGGDSAGEDAGEEEAVGGADTEVEDQEAEGKCSNEG